MAEFNSSQEVSEINERLMDESQARRVIRKLSDYWELKDGWKGGSSSSVTLSEEECRILQLKVYSVLFLLIIRMTTPVGWKPLPKAVNYSINWIK